MNTTLRKLSFAATLAAGAFSVSAQNVLDVQYANTKQTIQGFGTNISLGGTVWWRSAKIYPYNNTNIPPIPNHYSIQTTLVAAEDRIEKLADLSFNPDGKNATFLRVSNWYYYKDYVSGNYAFRPFGAEHQVGVSYYHWLMGTVRAMQEFRERKPNGKIILTAWSPPPWLKENGTVIGGNPFTGEPISRLRSNANYEFDYNGLAQWWHDSLAYYDKLQIKIDYLSIQNEPDFCASGWEGNFLAPTETYGYDSYPGYDKAFKAVYDKVKNSTTLTAAFKNNLQFMGPDVAGIRRVSDSPTNANGVTRYTNALMANNQFANIKAIAYHLYSDGDIQATSNMNALEAAFPYTNYTKIMSEYTSTKEDLVKLRWTHTARVIQQSLSNSRANAHILWDASGDNELALVHYSRFIPPGSIRVVTSTGLTDLVASAYRKGGRGTVNGVTLKDQVIVVLCDIRDPAAGSDSRDIYLSRDLLDVASVPNHYLKVYRTSIYLDSKNQPVRVHEEVNTASQPTNQNIKISLRPYDLVTVVLN